MLRSAETPPDFEQRLQEMQVVNDALSEEVQTLRRQLSEKDSELTRLRSRYAALLVETDTRIDEISRLELAAGNLIKLAEEPDEQAGNAVELLETLSLTRRRVQNLSRILGEHEKTISAVIDACQPSQALRTEAELSLSTLQQGVENCLQPLALSTAVDRKANPRSCAVLKVDSSTRVVILDQGFLHNVRTGMEFTLRRNDQPLARLKIVISRPLISAAEIIDGDFSALAPGVLLQRTQGIAP